MDELLRELLLELQAISERHKELFDSDVSEVMTDAIYDGFLKPLPGYTLPDRFRMLSAEGDEAVQSALDRYLTRARELADRLGLSFHERLKSFQDLSVEVGRQRWCYNDFFNHRPPACYDRDGTPLSANS